MTTRAALKANVTRRSTPEFRAQERARREDLIAAAELVAGLARHRDIEAGPVRLIREDQGLRRVLDTVVREFKPRRRNEIPDYVSSGYKPGAPKDREHVVPVRVIVDRMIKDPTQCRALLEKAVVIAFVTPEEHRQLGGIWTHHPEVYAQMLTRQRYAGLRKLGIQRYNDRGVELMAAASELPVPRRGRSGELARQ